MAAAQQAGVGGGGAPQAPGAPMPPMGAPPAPADPMAQLTQLLGGIASSPQGGAMMQAMTQMMGGAGGNGGADGQLSRMATAQAGSPRMPAVPNGGTPENRGAVGTGPGPVTDQGLTDMLNTSDAIRKDLPPATRDGYTGADSQEGIPGSDDPKLDDIGREALPWKRGQLQNDSYDGPGGSQKPNYPSDTAREPGQKNMGGYINANKPLSTEQELKDVSDRMGMNDPSGDGNFPTRADIKALNSGGITPKEFDAKWGKGAAKEMMDNADEENGPAPDDGDHEYR